MKVKDILNKVKANRYTYHNIDKLQINYFKDQYNYLKKHQNKSVYSSCLKEVNLWLNKTNELDYLKKIKAMQLISTNINHTNF